MLRLAHWECNKIFDYNDFMSGFCTAWRKHCLLGCIIQKMHPLAIYTLQQSMWWCQSVFVVVVSFFFILLWYTQTFPGAQTQTSQNKTRAWDFKTFQEAYPAEKKLLWQQHMLLKTTTTTTKCNQIKEENCQTFFEAKWMSRPQMHCEEEQEWVIKAIKESRWVYTVLEKRAEEGSSPKVYLILWSRATACTWQQTYVKDWATVWGARRRGKEEKHIPIVNSLLSITSPCYIRKSIY